MEPTELKAVIDRIEDGAWAVLLVGQEQIEKIVPVEQLPQNAKAGTWLRIRLEADVIQDMIVDADETSALRSRMASKLDKLRTRRRHFKPMDNLKEQSTEPTAPDEPQGKSPEQNQDFSDWEGYE